MSIGLRISFDIITGEFAKAMEDHDSTVAKAATGAMDDVAGIVKKDSRADIASAGFSKRWQNALRVNRYPDKKGAVSLSPSVYLYHKIEYAGVFEDGAVIKGSPLLWLPLSTTPQRISGNLVRPSRLAAVMGSRLFSYKAHDGTPLLGTRVQVSRSQFARPKIKVSLAALKRGNTGPKAEGTSLFRTIPLFFGVRQTTIPKKLSIRAICSAARDRIPALYSQELAARLK